MHHLILFSLTLLTTAIPLMINRITVEWIYFDTAKEIATIHKYQWLEDNTAILFDTHRKKKEKTFLKLVFQT